MEQLGRVLEVQGKMASIYIYNEDDECTTSISDGPKKGRAVTALNLINAREGQQVKISLPAKNVVILMLVYLVTPLVILLSSNLIIKNLFKHMLSSEMLNIFSSVGAIVLALFSGAFLQYLGKKPGLFAFGTPNVTEIIIRRK